TKVFYPESTANDPTLTSPLSSTPVTDQVYRQQTAYAPAAPQVTPAAPRPGPSRRRLLPLILILLAGVVMLGALLLASFTRRTVTVKNEPASPPPVPAKPPVKRPAQPAATVMSEEDADITDDKTVITKTYQLGDNATISLSNTTGNVTIEGWEESRAEVKVIKEGGSEQDRQAVEVRLANASDLLSLETSPTRSSPVEVHYALKLPRHVRQIELKSADSKVELSKIAGAVTIALQGSSIELNDVSGAVRTKIVKGDTKATLQKGGPGGPQEFSSVSGDIELQLEEDVNADIRAETIDGDIDVDDDLGLKVEKRRVGQAVAGRVGSGGVTISIKTVSGDIKISR
ncbi:MAG TPA: DUF4097 family beta strand repeat-containing protein, partial [Pyrinomonadaceae bacterium]|nr:DUF4097 family beta strand repeat-containing protein [Pyrinomonadaceae bacterium]